jgi:hypothetical protein
VLVIGAAQNRILNSLRRTLWQTPFRASHKEIDAGYIALFERADEFITLAIEFLFQQHD